MKKRVSRETPCPCFCVCFAIFMVPRYPVGYYKVQMSANEMRIVFHVKRHFSLLKIRN